ncbi:MAG: MCE family protein [Deltaproteobacteria bacterium]|nr:MCE family protein [Deltaproteobacteria bacterium]MBW1951680.1 MCE family protein [Deltaproteobacteria bacterium]MBW1987519.1 MCE family protein [Deltaproteobacteria bacterium]MBW2134694.1 MCE family protein [Deltaproteobacteria bacterium]
METKSGWSPEIKVGIFVLLALVLLAYMSLKVGFATIGWLRGETYYARFDSVSGLAPNGRVEIAGVEVGRIKNISLEDHKARVEVLLRSGLDLRQDAQAAVLTKGMLGEKYIELQPGTTTSPPLAPGGTITNTQSAVEFDKVLRRIPELMEELHPILTDVRAISNSLQRVIGTPEGESSLKQMLTNFQSASKSLSQLAQGLEQGQGTLGKLLKDDQLYRQVQGTMAELETAINNLNRFSTKLAKGEGTLGKLANDNRLYDQAQQAINRLNQLAQKIDQGQGTLGKLVNDESLYDETQKAVKNVNQAMEGIKEQTPITVLGTIGSTVLR